MTASLYSSLLLALASSAAFANRANRGWVFRKSTNGGMYEAGQTVVLEPLPFPPAPAKDEMLVRVIASSVIPSYRGRMDPDHWPTKNVDYFPFALNEPVVIEVALEVVQSNAAGFKSGDNLLGLYPLVEYQVIKADGSDTLFKQPPSTVDKRVPLEKYFSVLSIGGGLTAYHVVEYTNAGKVETPCHKTVLVTSAASVVGQAAGQLYKAKGCRVIGSTSTRSKAQAVMELGGFDHVIAYAEEDFEARLNELAPEGIDLDFENVGGTQFDAVLRNMKMYGKVVLCGFIADYNVPQEKKQGIKEAFAIVLKRITLEGIMVLDLLPHLGEAIPAISNLLLDGKLKSVDTTIYGFEKWGQAIDMMLSSKNTGRLVIRTDEVTDKDEL